MYVINIVSMTFSHKICIKFKFIEKKARNGATLFGHGYCIEPEIHDILTNYDLNIVCRAENSPLIVNVCGTFESPSP